MRVKCICIICEEVVEGEATEVNGKIISVIANGHYLKFGSTPCAGTHWPAKLFGE